MSGRRRWARGALHLGLTLLVTALLVRTLDIGWSELLAIPLSEWRPSWWLLGAASALLLLGFFVSGAIWGRIVADLGGPRLPAWDAARVFLVANLGRYVPGKIWQIAGLALLARTRAVPASIATGGAILGQAAGLGGAALVGSLGLVGSVETLGALGWIALPAVAAVVVAMSVPWIFTRTAAFLFRFSREEPPPDLAERRPPGLRWLLLYAANWVLYASSFVIFVRSFGRGGDPVLLGSAFAAAYLIGYLALFAPAGVGVREGILAHLLGPWIGPQAAWQLALVTRVWATLIEVVPAVGLALAEGARSLGRGRGPPASSGSARGEPGGGGGTDRGTGEA